MRRFGRRPGRDCEHPPASKSILSRIASLDDPGLGGIDSLRFGHFVTVPQW